jgi:magnesium-transporting ATPase (P-type)
MGGRESIKSRQSHKEDADILKKNFTPSCWRNIRCGDIIFLQDGDHLPADVVFLMSSQDNGECFV